MELYGVKKLNKIRKEISGSYKSAGKIRVTLRMVENPGISAVPRSWSRFTHVIINLGPTLQSSKNACPRSAITAHFEHQQMKRISGFVGYPG